MTHNHQKVDPLSKQAVAERRRKIDRRLRSERRGGFNPLYNGEYRRKRIDRRGVVKDRRLPTAALSDAEN